MWIAWAVRCTTKTSVTEGTAPLAKARSTCSFRGTMASLRQPPSAVITTLALESNRRSRKASALNPPNTTPCTAPIRAQANIATAASGIMGR